MTAWATHEGQRLVLGQKRMQVVTDALSGWATAEADHAELLAAVRSGRLAAETGI